MLQTALSSGMSYLGTLGIIFFTMIMAGIALAIGLGPLVDVVKKKKDPLERLFEFQKREMIKEIAKK